MAKSRKKKSEKKDFQKVKLKVGRKLPRGLNETNTTFKSAKIKVKQQIRNETKEPVTKRHLSLKDLLAQLKHTNIVSRHDAVQGLRELLTDNPQLVSQHLSVLLTRLGALFVDPDSGVRKAVAKVLSVVLTTETQDNIRPFFDVIRAHLCCAMTNISDEIKLDSLVYLDVVLERIPYILEGKGSNLLLVFVEQISTKKVDNENERVLLSNPHSQLASQKGRLQVFRRLAKFITALASLRTQTLASDTTESHHRNLYAQFGTCYRLKQRAQEGVDFPTFALMLFPLLLQCLTDCVAIRHMLSEESMKLFTNIVHIMQLIVKQTSNSGYSEADDRHNLCDLDVTSTNLAVCELAAQLLQHDAALAEQAAVTSLLAYVSECVGRPQASVTQIRAGLEICRTLLQTAAGQEHEDKLLDTAASIDCADDVRPDVTDLVNAFFMHLLETNTCRSPYPEGVLRWLQGLPGQVVARMGRGGSAAPAGLLRVVLRGVAMHHKPLLTALQGVSLQLLEQCASQTNADQRLVLDILYHVDWSEAFVEKLAKWLMEETTAVETCQYALQLAEYRFERPPLERSKLPATLYMSLLVSTLLGHRDMPKSRDKTKGVQLLNIEAPDVCIRQLQLSKVSVRLLNQIPDTAADQSLLLDGVIATVRWSVMPLHSVLALLALLVTSRRPPCDRALDFCTELAHAVLTFRAAAADLHPGVLAAVDEVIAQFAAMPDCIPLRTLLTKLLWRVKGNHDVSPVQRLLKTLVLLVHSSTNDHCQAACFEILANIAYTLQTRGAYKDETSEWYELISEIPKAFLRTGNNYDES